MKLATLTLFFVALIASSSFSAARPLPPSKGPDGVAEYRGGVVTYPIPKGMGFNGPWKVFREWLGPNVLPHDGFMRFEAHETRDPMWAKGRGRWIFVDLQPNLVADGGAALFKLRLNSMRGGEVQLTVLANLVLRIMDCGRKVEWARWTGKEFVKLADSQLQVTDGKDAAWHQVLILATVDGFTLMENGNMLFQLEKKLGEYVPQTFHMSRMEPDTSFSLDLSDIVTIPGPGASQT